MSSTGALGHVHCDMDGHGKKHEVKGESHCQHHSKKKSNKQHQHKHKRGHSSSCMVLCCVSTLSQPFDEDVFISPQFMMQQVQFSNKEENTRTYNYRLFRPPIA